MKPDAPAGLVVVALVLGARTLVHAGSLLEAGPVQSVGEGAVRAACLVATASAALLVWGLFAVAPWVGRAAGWWVACTVLLYAVEHVAGKLPHAEGAFTLGEAALRTLVVAAAALYVIDRAASLAQAMPRLTAGAGAP